MKIIFSGDLVLQGINSYSQNPFKNINHLLQNGKLITNLESPFVNDTCFTPQKSKVTLYHNIDKIDYLNKLAPYLISLSNNHIDDFGENSIFYTKKILDEYGFNYCGVGYSTDNSHICIDDLEKIIIVCYTSNETDLTGQSNFSTKETIGVKNINLKEVKLLKKQYSSYKLIIYLHWGVENINIPHPKQRKLGYELINHGADLIVGSHSHIIQPYEIYKNKYIFYSLGNFLFPEIKAPAKRNFYMVGNESFMKSGILVSFNTTNLELLSIQKVTLKEKYGLISDGTINIKLTQKNDIFYAMRYKYKTMKIFLENISPILPKVRKKIFKIFLKNINDYTYSFLTFVKNHRYIPNLKNPKSFSEKINHIKLFNSNKLRNKIVDRIWVRDYVKNKSQSCKLIQVLWSGTDFDISIWKSLPNEFVIKANHGSGMVRIVNKSIDDFMHIHCLVNDWLITDYASNGREWFYSSVNPYLIIEEKIQINGLIPPDFKFFCLNNKVQLVQVDSDRYTNHSRNLYDSKFIPLDIDLHYPRGEVITKPKQFDKAKAIAECLSSEFDFVRVDLYLTENNVYFGELTNIPGNGKEMFSSKTFDFSLGEELILDE